MTQFNKPAPAGADQTTPKWPRMLRVAALAAIAFAGGAATTHLAHAGPAGRSPYGMLSQLARVLVLVENEYVEPVDRERLIEGAVKGMVAELDPHSAYLPAQDYGIFQADTKGEFGGVGVEVDFSDDAVTVIAPIDGSPAARAGVRPGDRIIAIDSALIRGKSTRDLIGLMRGKPDTKVVLTVRRPGESKLLYFSLTREVIEVASIATKALDERIAYIRVKQFQSGTHTELLEAIAELRREFGGGPRGVLLDLRNNPGGLVDEATAVADEFLRGGVVFTTRHRKTTVSTVRARQGGALNRERMVVLVNEYSASAAELVAGALQDHGRATIVGAPTFGKGSVQTILDLPGGAGLRLTTMRYYTPNGHAIQAQGIRPDVLVEAAYVSDKTFGVLKEKDLDNHLPAEGTVGDAETEAPPTETPEGIVSETHLGVAREVPKNPTGGSDFALSIGYQILTGVLAR